MLSHKFASGNWVQSPLLLRSINFGKHSHAELSETDTFFVNRTIYIWIWIFFGRFWFIVVIDYFIHEQTGIKQSKYLVTFWTKNWNSHSRDTNFGNEVTGIVHNKIHKFQSCSIRLFILKSHLQTHPIMITRIFPCWQRSFYFTGP